MAEVPLDRLWQWWRELAAHETSLERQYKPLLEEYGRIHNKRMTVEQLIAQSQEDAQPQLLAEWGQLRAGEQLPVIERRPVDVAYEVLSRNGRPIHYKAILREITEAGTVIGGRDPGTTLIVYLGRDKRFTKSPEQGRGYYRLKEWEK